MLIIMLFLSQSILLKNIINSPLNSIRMLHNNNYLNIASIHIMSCKWRFSEILVINSLQIILQIKLT